MNRYPSETLPEANLVLVRRDGSAIIVQDDAGKFEYWAQSDDFAGYTLRLGGHRYEFCRSITPREAIGI